MAQYSYDDTGVYFAYFVVSVLSLILIPATYRFIRSGAASFKKASSCHCSQCQAKYRQNRSRDASSSRVWRLTKTLLIAAGWSLVGYLGYVIYTTELDLPEEWDPWKVLGVSASATRSQIKKAYYQLSLIHHPDKVADELKEKANKLFADISKAYKVLTNEEARKAFEEWGHPDGKQAFSMGIALPTAIVAAHNSPLVLLGYGLVFGVLLPYRIGRWWYRTRRFTKDGILSKTMGTLFKRLREDSGLRSVLVTVAHAAEFGDADEVSYKGADDDKKVAALVPQIQQAFADMGEDWEPERDLNAATANAPAARKALAHLLAHVVRPKGYQPDRDAQRTVARAAHIVQRGALQITLARGWLVPSLYCMDLTQLLAQAMWHSRSPLLQVPHVTLDHVKQLATRDPPVRSLQDFADMTPEARREAFKEFKAAQVSDVEAFLHAFPRIVLEKLDFRVVGEPHITPGSLVTCTLRVRLAPVSTPLDSIKKEYEEKKKAAEAKRAAKQATKEAAIKAGKPLPNAASVDDESDDEDEDGDFDALDLEGEGDGGRGKAALSDLTAATQVRVSHSPRFPADKRPGWWVFVGNLGSNRVITAQRFPAGLDLEARKTVKLQFQAPPQPGVYPFSLFIKSDHWVGADMRLDVQMKVEPPRADAVVEEEDDISDPDEDTLAGQMAVLRGQRTKQAAMEEETAGADDSDSSSDSDSD